MPSSARDNGLDLLRVLALVCVFLHHYLSVLDLQAYSGVAGIDLGQLGVAIFLAISGYLAGRDHRRPAAWLWRRLVRVYPAYWIAVSASVAGVLAVNYKPLTVGSVASQLLGTGAFTHPNHLANVATWFISLLLACYLAAACLRWLRATSWQYGLLAAALLTTPLLGVPTLMLLHAASFFAGMALAGRSTGIRYGSYALIGLGILIAMWVNLEALYVTFSIGLLLVGLRLPRSGAIASRITRGSYQFYLVHGPILVATVMWLGPRPPLVLVVSVVAAAISAVLLQRIAAPIEALLRQLAAGGGGDSPGATTPVTERSI